MRSPAADRRRRHTILTIASTLVLAAACTSPEPGPAPADLILRGGRIVTVEDAVPEAEAVAMRSGRIVFVGPAAEVDRYVGPVTSVVDLAGRLAVPGLIDGHAHLMGIGEARLQLDLLDTRSYEELLDRVGRAVAAAQPGQWIVGRGWHQSKWYPAPAPMVRGFQTHEALSAISPDNPVYLRHASGHAGFANARAMQLAGVTAATPDPEGGEIIRGADGRPTGIFVERPAFRILADAYDASRAGMTDEQLRAERRQVLRLAAEEVLSKGITTFHDAGVGPAYLAVYREAIDEGELKLRVWAMISDTVQNLEEVLAAERVIGYGGNRLTVRAIKSYADGALGSRGAWLLEEYEDDRGNTGHNTVPLETIREAARLALEHGYQLCTHAIGDRANREILDLYETALAAAPDAAEDARFRIEHAQILHPDDVSRFAELGVVAAMQGVHAISDGPWTPERLGVDRTRERAYQFRALLDADATVINGTDAPIEDVDPLVSFYGAVAGRMNDGEVLNPAQRMTRMEGLRSYTIGPAFAGHEEHLKGSIAVGKLADITVLSDDILTVAEDRILDTRVEMTVVGGEIVYRADGF
jgi:predicted amidohydrolase YtcJ